MQLVWFSYTLPYTSNHIFQARLPNASISITNLSMSSTVKHIQQNIKKSSNQAWWCLPVIPSTQEVESASFRSA